MGRLKRQGALFAGVILAILAFAGNSILTRLALDGQLIGPEHFSAIRLGAGAAVLAAILAARLCFSFAYVELGAAAGALILFSFVQLTLAGLAALNGKPFGRTETAGLIVAFAGVVWLLLPGTDSVSHRAGALMAISGMAWGVFTFLGSVGTSDRLSKTAHSFILAAPIGLVLPVFSGPFTTTATGVGLAAVSGAVTSGLGYVVWYMVLPRITIAVSASSQLLVPPITAAMAALLLGEALSGRTVIAFVVILTGLGVTLIPSARARATQGAKPAKARP